MVVCGMPQYFSFRMKSNIFANHNAWAGYETRFSRV